ncbi:hypothetical protein [Comamonas testosteroni]|uniref:hypothetical protein n=1 Tax=Comamonas testosteroni TaxID=285 RepID=UPI00391D7A2D
MPLLEKAMRAMTHLNIGAAIAMFAWILWSGQQMVHGDVPVVFRSTSAASAPPKAVGDLPLRAPAEAKP